MNNILNSNNTELYISLNAPYKNIQRILSYEDVLIANTMHYVLEKYFRFSFNNASYSNWMELTNTNLKFIKINNGEDFWIEYHYVLKEIDEGENIEFKSIVLEIVNYYGKIEKQLCSFNTSNDCCAEKTPIECCPADQFNPYDLGSAITMYNDLATIVNNVFGHEVEYYKTNPVLNSRDVILGEYSVHNIEQKKCIKVLIPDNALPTHEAAYNAQYGLGLQDLFEIHIVRADFENAFGVGERPRTEDYIYFTMLKKIYDVNAVVIADENALNTSTYYKVNLKEHSEKASRLDPQGLEVDLKGLYDSFEETLGEEIKDEQTRIRKPQQYNSMDTKKDGTDLIRSILNKEMVIRPHNLLNEKTYQVISDNYYDFTTTIPNEIVVTYLHKEGLPENFAFTFLLNIKELPISETVNIAIRDIYQSNTYEPQPTAPIIETLAPHNLTVGKIINIKNSTHYNGINYVLAVIDSHRFVITGNFKGFNGGSINKIFDKQAVIVNDNEFNIYYVDGSVIIKIKDNIYPFDFSVYTNRWLSFVINYSNKFGQLGLYVYDNFIKKFEKTILMDENYFEPKEISLVSGKSWFTNLRLFRECIEVEQHESILSQNVVIDSHLALIIDNATPRFRLQKHNAK